MKKIIVVLLLGLVALSCSKEEKAIKIAAILPLTGSASQWGIPPRDAIEMAVDEINASGGINGRKIKLNVQDDQCEPAKGVSALQNILATEKPTAIIGAVCSSVSLALAPVAEQNKIVMISPASTTPLLTEAGDYIFRDIPTDALRGRIFAEYVFSLGHKRVSILNINNDGGVGNQKTFADNFMRLGGKILSVETYAQDTRDMRTQLTKIKREAPDALIIVSYPDDTPLVLRQAKELKINVPKFFQTEALDDPSVLEKAGDAAEGVTYILPAKPEGSVVNSFTQKYKQRYGKDSELFAAEGYDAIYLIVKTLQNSKSMTSDEIKNGLYAIKDYDGASGKITFDKNGDVIKPMAIKQIQSRRPIILTSK